MLDYFYLFIYSIFSFISKNLPSTWLNTFFDTLSYFAYKIDKKHRNIIHKNLNLAFANTLSNTQKSNIAKHTYYNLLQTISGIMKRDTINKKDLLSNVHFKNEVVLQQAIAENKKIIFITAHYSNWELIPPLLTTYFDISLSIIGRKLDSERMNSILVKNRERFNVKMIYRTGAIKNAVKSLKDNHPIGLLLDQHLGKKQGGVEVSFFGHKAYHSPAAALLARMFDAVVIPVFISTKDYQNYTLTFHTPLPVIKTSDKEKDILQMCQAQSDIIEKIIKEKPNEWFWVHKRWKGFYPEIYTSSQK